MTTIRLPISAPYRNVPRLGRLPAIDVCLYANGRNAQAVGILDSGSVFSVFGRQVADALGIGDVTAGQPVTASTLAGPFDFFLFDVELETQFPSHRKRFPAQVGFFQVPAPRNILGRNLVFSHFQILFRERGETLYFLPED